MNNQSRIEVQGAVQQWIASFMHQYNIPAAMMEDALNKVLVSLKEQIVLDLMAEATVREEDDNGGDVESDN